MGRRKVPGSDVVPLDAGAARLRGDVRPADSLLLEALVFGEGGGQLPFHVAPLHGLSYALEPDAVASAAAIDRSVLANRLFEARAGGTDSSVLHLLKGFPDVQRLETDVFRDRVSCSEAAKRRPRRRNAISRAAQVVLVHMVYT
jgi:hypothetical protein